MAVSDKFKLKDGTEIVVSEHPELVAILEAARKQEKDKLYSEKATLDAKVKELETKLKDEGSLTAAAKKELEDSKKALGVVEADLAKNKAELENLKKAAPKPKKKKGDDDEDDDEPTLTAKQLSEAIDQALTKQNAEFEKKFAALKGEVSGIELEEYRKEVLKKNEGVLIPEFLTGSTKAELDKNLTEALEKSKKYLTTKVKDKDGKEITVNLIEAERLRKEEEEAQARLVEEQRNNGGGGGSPKPPHKEDTPDPKTLIKDVSKMSPEEYKKHRSEILKEAGQIKIGVES